MSPHLRSCGGIHTCKHTSYIYTCVFWWHTHMYISVVVAYTHVYMMYKCRHIFKVAVAYTHVNIHHTYIHQILTQIIDRSSKLWWHTHMCISNLDDSGHVGWLMVDDNRCPHPLDDYLRWFGRFSHPLDDYGYLYT